jgi:hypothetical protein
MFWSDVLTNWENGLTLKYPNLLDYVDDKSIEIINNIYKKRF